MRFIVISMLSWALMGSAVAMTGEETFSKVCAGLGDYDIHVVEDPLFDRVAGTTMSGEYDFVIRTNPELIPRLLDATRQFLFAHECARVKINTESVRELSVAEAHQADCQAVEMLKQAQLLQPNTLNMIATDLNLSDAEWQMVSGPQRVFDFAGCGMPLQAARQTVRVVNSGQPSSMTAWNACVRSCAQPLRACNTSGCVETYNQCVERCGVHKPAM